MRLINYKLQTQMENLNENSDNKYALETPKGKKELKDIVTTITETSTNKAKVKVNAKKKSSSNEAITIELLSNDIDDDSLKDVA
ncbi:hypothetical protein [Aliarcobacter butzleri]|uniref:hypothetical protein n=1 Tax=Aliarcobacter butzleri TaxID=28197 RepID=UPI00273885A4|nr:hypothetical protein [Aliarcobacter butzleri]